MKTKLLIVLFVLTQIINGKTFQWAKGTNAPVLFFSDLTDGSISGWEGSPTKGVAVSIWGGNFGSSRGSAYVTIGGVNLTNDSDYAEWGATTNPTVPLGMQRITFWLNSTMTTTGTYPNTTITVTTADGISESILFHTRETGTIYFLDNVNGSDSNNGLTVATAKQTTGWARGNLQAGDVVYLKANIESPYHDHDHGGSMYHYGGLMSFGYGTIDEDRNYHNGTEGNSITVTAYPGELVKLDGTDPLELSSVLNSCFKIFYAGKQLNYWTISKFEMVATWATISLGGSGYDGGISHVRIIGNDQTTSLTTTQQWGNIIVMYGNDNGMDHVSMHGNYLHDQCANFRGQNTGRQVYQVYIGGYGALDHIYVGWNEMGWGSQGRGFQVYGHLPTDSLDNFYVHNNWFHDNKRQCVILGGGDGGGQYEFIKKCYFYNNILSNAGNGDPTIVIGGINSGRYGGDYYIYNNIFFKTDDAFPTIHITGQVDFASMKNNIIIGYPNYWDYYTYYPDPVSPNLSGDHNIYFGAGTGAKPSWDSSTLENSNPLFVVGNPENFYDFALQSTSPAIDAGTSDVSLVVTTAFDGTSRPQGLAYDIGVYEYMMSTQIMEPQIQVPSQTLIIYPNPSNGIITIETKNKTDNKLEVLIYCEIGALVLKKELNSNKLKVDLPKGMYFIKLKYDEKIYMKKLFIK